MQRCKGEAAAAGAGCAAKLGGAHVSAGPPLPQTHSQGLQAGHGRKSASQEGKRVSTDVQGNVEREGQGKEECNRAMGRGAANETKLGLCNESVQGD